MRWLPNSGAMGGQGASAELLDDELEDESGRLDEELPGDELEDEPGLLDEELLDDELELESALLEDDPPSW